MGRQTIYNVQFLRFAAAGAVLFSHTVDLLAPPTSAVRLVPWTGGVDLFFVISGFIMTWLTHRQFGQPGAGPRYFLRRVVRIVPPYWFFTGLMLVTVLVFGGHVRNTTIGPVQITTSIAFFPWPRGDGRLNPILSQGWTLNYEMFFYACFAAALASRRGLLLLTAFFVALVALHPVMPSSWFVLGFYSDPIILEFLGGIGLARAYVAGVRLSRPRSLLCIALAVACFVALENFAVTIRAVLLGGPALLLAAGFILAPEPRSPGPLARMLKFGGDASYTLYLSHTFTVNAVVLLWVGLGLRSPVLAVICALVAALTVAGLIYKLAEAPFTRWLGGVLQVAPMQGPASVAP